MKSFSRYALFAALAIAAAVGSYLLGVKVGKSYSNDLFAGILASVQADLALNKVVRLRELEKDLSVGCSTEALDKIRIDIDTQMYVLSSLYKEHKNSGAMASISKRDPSLPAQLENFKRKNGDSWTEPKCTK